MVSGENHITIRECWAMQLLADEWTKGELRMAFHLSSTQMVSHHLEGECSHPPLPDAVAEALDD